MWKRKIETCINKWSVDGQRNGIVRELRPNMFFCISYRFKFDMFVPLIIVVVILYTVHIKNVKLPASLNFPSPQSTSSSMSNIILLLQWGSTCFFFTFYKASFARIEGLWLRYFCYNEDSFNPCVTRITQGGNLTYWWRWLVGEAVRAISGEGWIRQEYGGRRINANVYTF